MALLLPVLPAFAQQPVYDLEGGREAATPIAIVPMPYSGAAPAPETDIAQVVAADLNRSGRFRTLPEGSLFERPTRGADIRYYGWKALRQDYLVVGRVFDTGEGGYRVEYELHDAAREQRLIGQVLTAQPASMRDLAHQVADAIYEKITGVRGAFWTRMAYITQSGHGDNARWALVVADADGFNPREVASSRAPLISPAWSPDGRKLAYVDFDRGNSSVYIHDVYAGTRQLVSAFRGINGAPAFSPDGSKLALALSRTGQPEIYVMDLASRALTQLTDHFAIDTEPSWSPDGNWIYFTSDRSGNPQIYRMPSTGGAAERVSFEGRYNATPAVSDDGLKIAVVQAEGNSYRIAQMDNSEGTTRWSRLSPGNRDESPSFAPNGSMIVYAATEGGRGLLYVVSADGRVRQRLALSSDVREPAWGPYRSPR